MISRYLFNELRMWAITQILVLCFKLAPKTTEGRIIVKGVHEIFTALAVHIRGNQQ